MKKIELFQKVVETVIGQISSESYYLELMLTIALERMLQDILPEEEMLLKTMVTMFNDNPEYVSSFLAETLKRGALINKEKEEQIRQTWSQYIV